MTLRQLGALILFITALYYGILGIAMIGGGADNSTQFVALVFMTWGVGGIALAYHFGIKKRPK